ncbi:hypothetical protein BY996DRAFT_6586005 [Phakopsora pachyrhizi]|uniref:Uncharacterized protein n=1 Tax=Phakopsora pachyrhizi TaxID=170000 RepID=A0AAV0B0Y6_PHAPC|nr:hypothetical protein BY996DRAFT_6586005 [Phakopsora pachyrhizi]CAH7675847.1 hypothetical protein PPACK8108_LOCUS10925 [Phakopsora pachyrhizi]
MRMRSRDLISINIGSDSSTFFAALSDCRSLLNEVCGKISDLNLKPYLIGALKFSVRSIIFAQALNLVEGDRGSFINSHTGSHSTSTRISRTSSTKQLDDLTRPIRGKYIDLVNELNRQLRQLVKIQGIKPPIQSSTTDQSKSNKKQDDLGTSTQDNASEHHQEEIMGEGIDSENCLKDVDWRASTTGYKDVVELDLSLRNHDLKKVLINLSKPSSIILKQHKN